MPITSEWFDEHKTILYITYEGAWTIQEYRDNITQNANMIREQPHPVVSIVDFTDGSVIPNRIFSTGQHSETIFNKNNVANILFGLTLYMETIIDVLIKIFPKTTKGLIIVKTREEALQTAANILRSTQENY